jgi:hypothetical protein
VYGLADFRGGFHQANVDAGGATVGSIGANARATWDSSSIMFLAADSLQSVQLPNFLPALMKAGFGKLREVSITYALPVRWARTLFGASRASVSVAGRNLAILWREQRDLFGWKPIDLDARFPNELNGMIQNTLPQNTQLLMSVRVTF